MTEIEINSPESVAQPKAKRNYVRKPKAIEPVVAAIPIAEVPNPTILALQDDILQLVKQRGGVQGEIIQAGLALNQASARMQSARETLQNLEQEVQYRMNLIAQMKGGTGPTVMHGVGFEVVNGEKGRSIVIPDYSDTSNYAPQVGVPPGVGSIPAAVPNYAPSEFAGARRIRGESAESVRAAM